MSKVLIVDDHPAIRLAVRLLFERDEFHPSSARPTTVPKPCR